MDPQNVRTILKYLFENGPATAKTLEVDALGDVDQIDTDAVTEWCETAQDEGWIERVAGSHVNPRWQITDKGRRSIGDEPGR